MAPPPFSQQWKRPAKVRKVIRRATLMRNLNSSQVARCQPRHHRLRQQTQEAQTSSTLKKRSSAFSSSRPLNYLQETRLNAKLGLLRGGKGLRPAHAKTSSSPAARKGKQDLCKTSVLGPLLFNLYVADLPEIAQENRVALPSFADDMSLYCSRTTELEACKDASSALSVLHQAIQDIGLEINAEKTTSMIISPHRRSQTHQQAHCSIYCKDKKVSMVTESRLLGVIVDNNLTWSAHVDTVYSKVVRKIGAMKRTSRQLSLKARRSFFLSVIQPDLEYAAGACVPSMPESQRQRLLSLWRKAVRCTAGADKHADVYTICGELSITPLLHRWALSFALQVRRCYLNIALAQLCDKLVRPCHKHSTRGNNSSLYPFRSSSLSGTVSFTNRSPILWNALQSVSGSEISTLSQSKFKKSFLDLLLVYSKFISFTVGDINSCI